MSIPLLPEFDADGYQVEPTTAKINEIIAAVNSGGGGGGGGGATFPMAEGVWYDNRTALACVIGEAGDQDEPLAPGTLYASPFRVFDAVVLTSVGVMAFNGLAEADSVSVSIYEPSASAGPGEKIAGPIAIAIPSEGNGLFSAVANVPLDPGVYFFVVSGNTEGGVMVGAIADATSSVLGGANLYDFMPSGYYAEVVGVPGVMPEDLSTEVTTADLVEISAQVLFQITHD